MFRQRRREFSKDVRRQAYTRSRGRCESGRVVFMPQVGCGARLGPGNTFYEHIICDGVGGDPTLENAAVLCKTCWRLKTGGYDQPIVAHVRRVGDRFKGIDGDGLGPNPLPAGRDDRIKKRMDGVVVVRATGERA